MRQQLAARSTCGPSNAKSCSIPLDGFIVPDHDTPRRADIKLAPTGYGSGPGGRRQWDSNVRLAAATDLRALGLEVLRDTELDQGILARREQMGHINSQERIGEERRHDPYPGPYVHGSPPVAKCSLFCE